MLRFIKHNLSTIDGVSIYPILSLLIFVLFFAFMLGYVIRMKKPEIEELSQLPFEKDNQENEIKFNELI
jgi:cytochrome c oxidase cbb3-type subunit IV